MVKNESNLSLRFIINWPFYARDVNVVSDFKAVSR